MNKNKYIALLFFATLFVFSSCEEVIVLDLNTVTEQIVIEANLNVTAKTCTVSISESVDFYAENDFDKILGATISLTTSSGSNFTLDEIGEGEYIGNDILTSPGEVITIDINIPDIPLISTSAIVPKLVNIDTLIVEENTTGFGGGPGGGNNSEEVYELTIEWQDIEGEENFYRIKVFKNGTYQSDIYALSNDLLGDGERLIRPIIGEQYALGDELRVELLSVNKGYYQYFSDIANGEGRGFSAPVPFNPSGNIDQTILGYFGIWQVSEKTIIVE